MVLSFLPATADTGVTHERTGLPLTGTVQAPHCAAPQPNLVPVRPSSSRTTQISGVSACCSEYASLSLMVNLTIGMALLLRGETSYSRACWKSYCSAQQTSARWDAKSK